MTLVIKHTILLRRGSGRHRSARGAAGERLDRRGARHGSRLRVVFAPRAAAADLREGDPMRRNRVQSRSGTADGRERLREAPSARFGNGGIIRFARVSRRGKKKPQQKTFPLLLGDLFALYLLRTFKIPPLYFNKTLRLKHLVLKFKRQSRSVPSFICKYFAQT